MILRTYPDKFVDAGIDWLKDEPQPDMSAEDKRVRRKFKNKMSFDEYKELSTNTSECLAVAKRDGYRENKADLNDDCVL